MNTTNSTFIQTILTILSICMSFIYPAIPYILIAIILIIIDNISAYMCNRRIYKKYPTKCHSNKYSSAKATKTIKSIGYSLAVILISFMIEKFIIKDILDVKLTAVISSIICAVQILSILENVLTENDNVPKWLKVLSKYIVNKAERYFDTDLNNDNKIGLK